MSKYHDTAPLPFFYDGVFGYLYESSAGLAFWRPDSKNTFIYTKEWISLIHKGRVIGRLKA
jgi:hypothetical protein